MLINLFVIDPALVRMAHDDVRIPLEPTRVVRPTNNLPRRPTIPFELYHSSDPLVNR